MLKKKEKNPKTQDLLDYSSIQLLKEPPKSAVAGSHGILRQ